MELTGKNVLVLHSFESNVPIFELTDRGLKEEVVGEGGIGIRNQFFEYLDIPRNPGPEDRNATGFVDQFRGNQRRVGGPRRP